MMGAGSHVFAVMSYVIAKTVNSRVELNPNYLAAVIGDTPERMQQAIDFLAAPDPRSTHEDHEGRRLVQEGRYSYFVPTHELYRSITNSEELKEANRNRVAKHRAKKAESDSQYPKPRVSTTLAVGYQMDTAEENALEIYGAYPKKVGRPKALESIKKALKTVEFKDLLTRTQRYSAAQVGRDMQYVPNPATWFNQQRYNDSPETWTNGQNGLSSPAQLTQSPNGTAHYTAAQLLKRGGPFTPEENKIIMKESM